MCIMYWPHGAVCVPEFLGLDYKTCGGCQVSGLQELETKMVTQAGPRSRFCKSCPNGFGRSCCPCNGLYCEILRRQRAWWCCKLKAGQNKVKI